MKQIRETLLGLEDLHSMTLNVSCEDQGFLDWIWELAFQSFQNLTNRLSVLNQLADILIQQRKYLLEFGLDVF